LNLSANEISQLPATISRLVNLRSLRLQHCKFTEFPAVIGSLESVEILMLNGNRITSIPSDISNMQSLVDLYLQENSLTSLPNELGQIISLRRLFLEFNKISSIPREILDLNMLLQLNLHHNEMTSCPTFLKNLKSLLRFNIDNNPLDETGEQNKTELTDILIERDMAISTPTVRIKTSNFASTKSDSDTGLTSKSGRPFALRQNSRSLVSIQEMLGREAKEELLPFRSTSRKNTDTGSVVSVSSNPDIYVNSTTSSPEGTLHSEKSFASSSIRRTDTLSPLQNFESPKLRISDSHARDHAPNYSKFREPFEAMMEEQGYSKEKQEVLSKLTTDQKWSLLRDRKPYVPLLLKQDTGRKSRAFVVSKQQQRNKPGDYVILLQRGRFIKDDLTQLLSQLRQNNDSFCIIFIESGGLDELLRIIENKSVMVKPTKQQTPDLILLEVMKCFCALLETQTSVVISISEAISIVGLHYDSEDVEVSTIVLRIFEEISQLTRVGRELVMEAIRHHNRWKWRETSQRPQPLSTIASLLSDAITNGKTSLVHTIVFTINRILSEEQDLETRFDLRNTLINLGILHLFTRIKSLEFTPHDTEAITQQVDSFESDLFSDEEDMIEKYGKNVVWERKQKETTKQGNFMFVTDLNRPGSATAIFPYEPEMMVSTLLENTLSYLQAVQSPKIEYGLFIPSEGKGYWLDCTQNFSSHNLKGQIYVEFSMKSFTIDVVNMNTQERKEFVLTPGSEVAKIVRMLMRDGFQTQVCTTDKMDSYGLYIPSIVYQAPTSGQMTVNEIGQLLDNTKRLAQYMDPILMSGADHLQLKPKPIIVKVLLPGDNFSTFYFSPDVLTKTVKKTVHATLKTGDSEEEYGLNTVGMPHSTASFNATRKPATFVLSEEVPIGDYNLNENTPVKLKLLPRVFRIVSKVGGKVPEKAESLDVMLTSQQILDFVCMYHFQLEQDPEKPLTLYAQTQGETEEVELSLYMPLRDQIKAPRNKLVILYIKHKEEGDEDKQQNIWDDKSVITYEDSKDISYATFNKLVETATSPDNFDNDFTDVFFLCFQSFSTPEELLHKLIERYNTPYQLEHTESEKIKLRVCVFIKHWLNSQYQNHSEKFYEKIEAFIQSTVAVEFPNVVSGLQVRKDNRSSFSLISPSTKPKSTGKIETLFDIDPTDFAEQATLRGFHYFQVIAHTEFFNQSWVKEEKRNQCPNLLKTIESFNEMSLIVQTAILNAKKIRDRVKVFEYFIKVANAFRLHRNFHLLIAIISAISSSALLRLNWTRERLSRTAKNNLAELEQLMDMGGSFKTYREILKERETPCFPYIGVYLTDLIFIEEGNPLKIGQRINFSRARYVRNIIYAVQRYQESPYTFSSNEDVQKWIDNAPKMEPDEQYKVSLEIEPRGATKNEIL